MRAVPVINGPLGQSRDLFKMYVYGGVLNSKTMYVG